MFLTTASSSILWVFCTSTITNRSTVERRVMGLVKRVAGVTRIQQAVENRQVSSTTPPELLELRLVTTIIVLCLFSLSIYFVRALFFFSSFLRTNADPRPLSKQALLPPPHYGMCLHCFRETIGALASLFDSHRIAPAHALLLLGALSQRASAFHYFGREFLRVFCSLKSSPVHPSFHCAKG